MAFQFTGGELDFLNYVLDLEKTQNSAILKMCSSKAL
jgi:hypothetical protein